MSKTASPRRGTRLTAIAAAAVLTLGGASASAAAAAPPTTAAVAASEREQDLPRVAERWASAWNSGDPQRLGRLFTQDARYTDHAFSATSTGRDGVTTWAGITYSSIERTHIELVDAFRSGDQVAIEWTFSGQITGAPTPFTVPAVTVLTLEGGKIATDDDYYDLADVLRQSGLPADIDLTAPPA